MCLILRLRGFYISPLKISYTGSRSEKLVYNNASVNGSTWVDCMVLAELCGTQDLHNAFIMWKSRVPPVARQSP